MKKKKNKKNKRRNENERNNRNTKGNGIFIDKSINRNESSEFGLSASANDTTPLDLGSN